MQLGFILVLSFLSFVASQTSPDWWINGDCSSQIQCRCKSETDEATCLLVDTPHPSYHHNCSEMKNLPISSFILYCESLQSRQCGVINLDLLMADLPGLYTMRIYQCKVHAGILPPASLNEWNWKVSFDWKEGIGTSHLAFFLSLQIKDTRPADSGSKCLLHKLEIIDGGMFNVPSLLLQRCQSLYYINLTGNYFTDLLPIDLALLFFSDTLEVIEISGGQLYSAGETVMNTAFEAISHYLATEFPKRIADMKKEINNETLEALEALQRRFQGWTNHTIITTNLMVEIKETMWSRYSFLFNFLFPRSLLQIFNAHNNHLLELPLALMGQREIVSLDLHNNTIGSLQPLKLFACDKKKLKRLNLRNNTIIDVPKGVLKSFKGLTIVDLSHNKIKELETSLFHHSTVLELLDIRYNAISDAQPFALGFKVIKLLLSDNKITQFSTTIGNFARYIEVLDLSYNKIQFITSGSFKTSDIHNLKVIDLTHNPISIINQDVFHGLSYLKLIIRQLPPDVLCNCQSILTNDRRFSPDYPSVGRDKYQHCITDQYHHTTIRSRDSHSCFVNGSVTPNIIDETMKCNNVTSYCPQYCLCYITRHLKVVEIQCVNTSFTYIPTIYVNATELRFDGNNFGNIGNNPFNSCLNKIEKLYMKRCGIRRMRPGLFKELIYLKNMYLSYNLIQHLNSSVFDGLNYLTFIDLRYNLIATITPISFTSVVALNRLKLNGNNLTCDCSTTLRLLDYSRKITVLLPDNCTVASYLRVVTDNETLPLQQSSISHICKLYDNYNANLRSQQFQKSLAIYITTGVVVLVSIILLGLVVMKRVSIKVFLDLHIQATGVRSLFRLRTQHQKEFDVGFLFTDTHTVQHDHLQLCIRKSKRKNLRTVALFHHLPGSARLRGLWSLMKRVEVIVVLASMDLFEDDYYYEALDMIVYEACRPGGSNNLIVVQLDEEVSKTDAWKIISCNPRRIFVLRWNEYLFCERLFAALPPPRIDEDNNSDDEANLMVN